jgi:hypothetical protein
MDLLRRIATAIGICAALCAATGSNALAATKPSLLLVTHTSKSSIAVGTELVLNVTVPADTVTTKTGKDECESPMLTGRVTANGGASISVELTRSAEQEPCFSGGAMPFGGSTYLWAWGNFPFNHSFGKLVMKPKGKSAKEGNAEMVPSPETSDLLTFAHEEGALERECSYSFKRLKGLWFSGAPTQIALNKGDKMKSDGSENEALCPKTATIPIHLNLRAVIKGTREVVEVELV